MILQVIWEDAIQRELGIDLIDLPQYRAVLVIPSLYKYAHNHLGRQILIQFIYFSAVV